MIWIVWIHLAQDHTNQIPANCSPNSGQTQSLSEDRDQLLKLQDDGNVSVTEQTELASLCFSFIYNPGIFVSFHGDGSTLISTMLNRDSAAS